ncbi:MAG: gliding motility-associated-like protein [Cyclobacteriaceae bacterium]|jgi:gliding motility-associated-like protein
MIMVLSTLSNAQIISETQWFFGQSSANLQFDKNGQLVYEEERMNPAVGIGGTAVVSDPFNGNLLFYSDGQNVYDASHQVAFGGANLGGTGNLNQNSVVAPFPGTNDQYLLFVNGQASASDQISFVELNASTIGNGNSNAPLGAVGSITGTSMVSPAEGMLIIKSRQPRQYWLIAQNRNTFDFYVTSITPTGVGSTQTFALDSSTLRPGAEAAQFAFNQDSALLAVAPKDPNRNLLLLDFDDSVGTLSFREQIINSGFNDQADQNIYDVAWSPSGTKLFYSRFGDDAQGANVYEIDMQDSLLRSTPLLQQSIHRSYGLKIGIDNRLYHLYQPGIDSAFRINRFSDLDSAQVFIESNIFDEDFNGRQFPAFAAPDFDASIFQIDIDFIDVCEGNVTKFFPRVTPVPNNYGWTFDADGTSRAVAPLFEFVTTGVKTITLSVELNGVFAFQQFQANILPQTETIDIGADTVICVDETLMIPNDPLSVPGAQSYVWSTGETGTQIQIDTAGTYWVEVTFASGCTAFASKEVTEYGVSTNLANQWYFGDRAGLDFNTVDGLPPPPRALVDDNMMFSNEGCATMSNSDGNLLFYTNGDTVWNRSHEVMISLDTGRGQFLGGDDRASQGALILPFMDDQTLYYVFSAQQVYGTGTFDLRYAVIDMKKDSAKGAIIAKDLILSNAVIEKVTASSFEISSWLVAHEFGNNNFKSHLIDAEGIQSAVHSPMGEVLVAQQPEEATGYMKFNVGVSRFVNLIPGRNEFEIFDFDNFLGRFSNPRLIESGETDNLYGVEFSGGANKLYLTTSSKLMQYDLDSLGTETEIVDITNSKFDGYSTTGTLGAIQRGPNGVLYIAVNDAQSIPFIASPNDDDAAAAFNQAGVSLIDRTSKLGLPNFTQSTGSPPTPPGLQFINACLGQETQFFATGTSDIDEYFWTFDSTATFLRDIGEQVTTTYGADSLHIVELNITNRCNLDTVLIDTVEVFNIPEQPIFPDETNLCAADSLQIELWFEDRGDLSFEWYTVGNDLAGNTVYFPLDTSRILTIDDQLIPAGQNRQIAGLILTDQGCRSDTVTFNSANTQPFLDLGLNQQVCQFETISNIDANVSGVTFQWWINDSPVANLDSARFQPVNTNNTGDVEYVVRIREPFFQCTNTDTLVVTIQEAPSGFGTTVSPSFCGGDDAEIAFDISTAGAFLYELTGDTIIDQGALTGPGTSAAYTGLNRGIYNLALQNIVSGCTNNLPIIVDDDVPFELSATNLPDCQEDVDLQLTISGTQLPDFVSILIANSAGDTIFSELDTTVPIEIYPGLDDGLYYVTVRDRETGCIQADSVLIRPLFAETEDCKPQIFAPNAFSPNGNGQNETFFVYPNPFIDKFEIFIYSRWGELVYYSDQKDFQWDGYFNGAVIGPATFSYVIKFTSIEQPSLGALSQFGSITIIR